VVPSSCIVDRFYFLARGRMDDRTRVFLGVGPLMRGRRKDTHAEMHMYNSLFRT
jgi:hypothetical protein